MDKSYDPQTIEQRWYQIWEEKGYFAPQGSGPPYCIMIPPPNVTGHLHMGHAFQDTLMDALIRYHRMRGDNTLWQVGTDHAGIATQIVVEHQLNAEEHTRHDLGREAFIQRVWEWKAQSGGTITRQLRRMGASVDWSRERFTMDEGLSHAVCEVFVRLYEEGLIYRGQRLVNWDPVLHTAISDLEVVSEEENSHLWHMRYPLANGDGHLVVATTRPETMLGDTAVAVHPQDSRYQYLIGKEIALPLTNRTIPIIADDYVDPEFGSGCVKITPAHDFNDYEVWQRHKQELANQPQGGLINILTVDARVKASPFDDFTFGRRATIRDTHQPADEAGLVGKPVYELIPKKYRGLDRFEARKQIVADLEAGGLLEKIEDHKLMVPRGDRSRTVIEPYLTDQWFVKAAPLAEPAIKVVEEGQIRFIPENWSKIYFEWMQNIQDWCISRQIWWGHRIPAWYDPKGKVYVASTETQARQKYGLPDDLPLEQDPDVLDTWFSSALWPFSTLGWPEKTLELRTFYPTNVLVTGFDIIFFWVARMIMMGLQFTGEVPFREVYIHGLIRDAEGQKMSKSKGNVLDPLDLINGIDLESLVAKRTQGLMQPTMSKRIEKATRKEFPQGIPAFGCDALRFTFAVLATRGRDIRFDMGRIEGYRNFCNKLWNASRYVLMNMNGSPNTPQEGEESEIGTPERWILSRLQSTIQQVIEGIESYRFDRAAQAIYDFTWNEYCDWYLELSKPVLSNPASSEAAKRGTRCTLVQVLEALLRLAHPIIPFITEEIWQRVAPIADRQGKTIMLQPYPQLEIDLIDQEAVDEIEWVRAFVTGVRSIRSQMNISPRKSVPLLLQAGSIQDQKRLEHNRDFLSTLAKLESIQWLGDETPPPAATALVGELKLLIPLAGLIDKEAELKRLDREIQKMRKDLEQVQGKLANPNYVERAPAEIVAKERQRAQEVTAALSMLEQQYAEIAAL